MSSSGWRVIGGSGAPPEVSLVLVVNVLIGACCTIMRVGAMPVQAVRCQRTLRVRRIVLVKVCLHTYVKTPRDVRCSCEFGVFGRSCVTWPRCQVGFEVGRLASFKVGRLVGLPRRLGTVYCAIRVSLGCLLEAIWLQFGQTECPASRFPYFGS